MIHGSRQRERTRLRLGFASAAVFFAAADTYVVVLALTAIMFDLGISIDQLQQATPIISGFLLGYVAVLPLLGRLSDIFGRAPVLLSCLGIFTVGSVLTASGHSLPPVVMGRLLQGMGGGGLVPVTLALVADSWAADKRGLPLGVVAAVQELGSVIGPLYGALVMRFSNWRTIFWINVPMAALLGLGFAVTGRRRTATTKQGHADIVGILLLFLTTLAFLGAVVAPDQLSNNDIIGVLYTPIITGPFAAATTYVAVATVVLGLSFLAWEWMAPATIRRVVDVRRVGVLLHGADWLGAVILAAVLGCIVVTFAAADPSLQVISSAAPFLLPLAAGLAMLFVIVERRSPNPLVPFSALTDRAAVGAMLTNLAVGAALMSALVDVPILARATVFPDSQVDSALVLVRMLAAIPVGAVLGGVVCDRVSYRLTAAAGMLLCAGGFLAMTGWTGSSLTDSWLGIGWLHPSDPALIACGLGFGLAIAPVNAAILGVVPSGIHGLASSLVVVARTVGMVVGLSLLTALGLHDFYTVASKLPSSATLCPSSPGSCAAYDRLAESAILGELHTIFAGAAVASILASGLALGLLRRRQGGQRSASLSAVLAGG